jgi:hypothetical protein
MITVNAPTVRYAEIHHSDTIKRIALRELGAASKWVSLVILNELKPPYIAETASAGVLGYGDLIKIPSSSSYVNANADPVAVFGADILLDRGKLLIDDGDLVRVLGVKNFTQALTLHINVNKRELAFHPKFGCFIRSVIGNVNGPTAGQLAALYVKSALLEDKRVSSVPSCKATVLGDQISVNATVKPISGKPVDFNMVI